MISKTRQSIKQSLIAVVYEGMNEGSLLAQKLDFTNNGNQLNHLI